MLSIRDVRLDMTWWFCLDRTWMLLSWILLLCCVGKKYASLKANNKSEIKICMNFCQLLNNGQNKFKFWELQVDFPSGSCMPLTFVYFSILKDKILNNLLNNSKTANVH